MKEFFQRTKMDILLMALMTIALGVLLMLNPTFAVLAVCRIVGWILLIGGIFSVITYFFRKSVPSSYTSLLIGIIETALGLWIAIRPGTVVQFVSLLFAVILILHGARDIRDAIEMKQMNYSRWWLTLVFAVLTIAFGIFVLLSPIKSAGIMMTICGIALIFDGITDIVITAKIGSLIKKKK